METEHVVEEVTEQVESNEKNKPFVAVELWPFRVAIWENRTQNGGTSYRVQFSVSRLDKNGERQTDSVFFPLRDAFAANNLLRVAADEALDRVSARRTK